LKSVESGVSVSWLATVLTSENRRDLRKNSTNFSDWRDTRRSRTNLAKMMIQEMREKRRRIPRTILAVGPVSLKKERIPCPWPRFSTCTA